MKMTEGNEDVCIIFKSPLERKRAATLSDEQKQKKKQKSEEEIKKKRLKTANKAKSKGKSSLATSPYDRVKQNPNQGLKVVKGELFCEPCGKPIGIDYNTVKTHCSCSKHQANLKRQQEDQLHQQNLKSHLNQLIEKNEFPEYEGSCNVDDDNLVFRVDLVKKFLEAGISV